MKAKRVIAVLAVAMGVGALLGTPSANAASGVFVSTVPMSPLTAQSYNLLAVGGLLNIPPVEAANCGPGQSFDISAPTIPLGTLATINAVSATCAMPGPLNENINSQSTASAAKVSLLGGKIVLTGVRTQCFVNPQGFVTAESTVATINGSKISLGALNLTIPGLATIALDQNSQSINGPTVTVRSVGVTIKVLPYTTHILGKTVTVPAQTVTVDTCSITGLRSET